eukprot:7626083-Alexandrium_andersonii.AAC.1
MCTFSVAATAIPNAVCRIQVCNEVAPPCQEVSQGVQAMLRTCSSGAGNGSGLAPGVASAIDVALAAGVTSSKQGFENMVQLSSLKPHPWVDTVATEAESEGNAAAVPATLKTVWDATMLGLALTIKVCEYYASRGNDSADCVYFRLPSAMTAMKGTKLFLDYAGDEGAARKMKLRFAGNVEVGQT